MANAGRPINHLMVTKATVERFIRQSDGQGGMERQLVPLDVLHCAIDTLATPERQVIDRDEVRATVLVFLNPDAQIQREDRLQVEDGRTLEIIGERIMQRPSHHREFEAVHIQRGI